MSAPPSDGAYIHELKFDGYRMQLQVAGGIGRWFSRNGHDCSDRFTDYSEILADLPDCVLDGEVCALNARGHPDFSALRSHMGARQRGSMTGALTFFAFDILIHDGDDVRRERLSFRKALLEDVLADADGNRLRIVDTLPGGGRELLTAACRMNLEGIVSKRMDAPYEGGDVRKLSWVKSECRPSQEIVVCGWEESGTGLRSLLGGVYDDGALTYVGSLGTGFTQDSAGGLLKKLRALEVAVTPYKAGSPPRKTSAIHWARPDLVAAVEIAEWTSSGRVRQASFKGLREDKRTSDVVREQSA